MKMIMFLVLLGISSCGRKASHQIASPSVKRDEVVNEAPELKFQSRLLKTPRLRVSKILGLILWSGVSPSRAKVLDRRISLDCGPDQICEISTKDKQ